MAVRQSPYYHNCKLLSPDGSLLAIVDRKKLDWYAERNLGGKITLSIIMVNQGKTSIITCIMDFSFFCRNC